MHVTKASDVPPANVQHRVVAVNASSGFTGDVEDWGRVPPHHCFLEFSPGVGKALLAGGLSLDHSGKQHISLHGWSVTLLNPAGSKADVHIDGAPDDLPPSPDAPRGVKVPCLTDFLPTMVLKEGIADADVPDWAACFVNINSGTVTASEFPAGAIYTTWSAETEGDPKLQFTRLVDGLQETLTIEIPSTPPSANLAHDVPGSMVVHNGTGDQSDKQFDFVLHFLANVDGVPTRKELAKPIPTDPPPTAQISMTTSCSNSQYP
jgi:hypothetical protein